MTEKLFVTFKLGCAIKNLRKAPQKVNFLTADVVYIGTLHTVHLQLVKQAMEHGKHVLCEKPLAMNVKETKEIVEFARQKKLFLMEAIWTRFFPAYVKLREELEKGTIGEVYQVVATMGIAFPEDNWRR